MMRTQRQQRIAVKIRLAASGLLFFSWFLLLPRPAAAAAPTVHLLAETQQGSMIEKQLEVTVDAGNFNSLELAVTYDATGSVPTVNLIGAATGASLTTNPASPGVLAVALASSSSLPNGATLAIQYPGTANPSAQGAVRLMTAVVDEIAAAVITEPVTHCFILTAAYGRPDAPEIQALWVAHNRLLPGKAWDASWHQSFLRWYQAHGPAMAGFIEAHPVIKPVVRVIAAPAVAAARWWLARQRR